MASAAISMAGNNMKERRWEDWGGEKRLGAKLYSQVAVHVELFCIITFRSFLF